MRKNKRQTEPSLLRQIIEIHYEQAKRRKALRILEKQVWSLDFLSLMLVRAGQSMNKGLTLEIEDKDGKKIRLSYDRAATSVYNEYFDDNIFNKLDNDAAVNEYIKKHSRR